MFFPKKFSNFPMKYAIIDLQRTAGLLSLSLYDRALPKGGTNTKKILALSLTFVLMVVAFGTVAMAATGTLELTPTVGSYKWASVTHWWRAYAQQVSSCSESHSVTRYTKLTFNDGNSAAEYSAKVDRPYPSSSNSAEGYMKVSCIVCETVLTKTGTTSRGN